MIRIITANKTNQPLLPEILSADIDINNTSKSQSNNKPHNN